MSDLKKTEESDKTPKKQGWKEVYEKIASLERLDNGKKKLLDPVVLRQILGKEAGKHVAVASYCDLLMNLIAIQRGPASSLPRSNRESIPMKGLFKKVTYITKEIGMHPDEIQEYQHRHRLSAE